MKISTQKLTLRDVGTRLLRLVYDHGYATNTLDGHQNKRKHSYETLDLYVHDKPKTPIQRQHNKEHMLLIIEQRRMEAMLRFPDIFSSSGKNSAT